MGPDRVDTGAGPVLLPEIYVDADACPVKEEILRVAGRHGLAVHLVSNGGIRPRPDPKVRIVVVGAGADAADDWIADHIGPGDIAVTNDVPLADRCLKRGAAALRPDGRPFSENSIGLALATRDLMAGLREQGEIAGGPPPFSGRDRSRFLQSLDTAIQAARRG